MGAPPKCDTEFRRGSSGLLCTAINSQEASDQRVVFNKVQNLVSLMALLHERSGVELVYLGRHHQTFTALSSYIPAYSLIKL